jgi:hypothetical protein
MGLAEGIREAANSGPPGHKNLRQLDTLKMLETKAPPVVWMVGGIAAAGHLTLLAGREKVGKSLLALHLAAAVANAKVDGVARYLGGIGGIACAPGRVAIFDAENGEAVLHRRVQTCGLKTEAVDYFTVVDAFGFDLADEQQLAAMASIIREREIDLFVLDGFRAMWRGLEVESAEVSAALDPLRHLCHTSRAAGILLHHARKASGESADSYRGGTGVGAAVESIVEIARMPGDPDPRRRRIVNPSCRFAVEHDTRWIRLGGEDAEHVRIEPVEPMLSAAAPKRAEKGRAIIDLLLRVERNDQAGQNAADITRALGLEPPNGTVNRALKDLEHAHYIAKGEKGRWTVTDVGRSWQGREAA